MVNIRLAMIGKRAEAELPAPRRDGRRDAGAPARGLFQRRAQAARPARSISARQLGAGDDDRRPGADPGARHDDGAVRARHLHGGALGRADHHGGRRVMTDHARSGHARSHPQRAAGRRQRDGDRPAAHLLQHDDLRGARLLHRADQHRGRADLPERRRRVALRRRPRRHHHRRHEALRQATASSRATCIITNHQAVAGQHLNNVVIYMPYFYRGRAADVRHGAGALDRRRRHEHRLRRRSDRRRSVDRGAAARPAQDLRGRQARRHALPRAQGQHPLSGILARRHEVADGGLPAGGAAHGRAVRQIRPRHHPRGDRADLRRDRDQVPQRGVAARRRRLRGSGRARRGRRHPRRAGADPRQGHDRRAAR